MWEKNQELKKHNEKLQRKIRELNQKKLRYSKTTATPAVL
jgi:hypothetical protein